MFIHPAHFAPQGDLYRFSCLEHTMVFCVSGSGTGHFENKRKEYDFHFPIVKNQLFYFEPIGHARIISNTNNFVLLILEFSIYSSRLTAAQPPDTISGDFFNTRTLPNQYLSMNLPFMTKIDQSELLTHYLYEILRHIDDAEAELANLANTLLPSVIIHWLRVSQKEIRSTATGMIG